MLAVSVPFPILGLVEIVEEQVGLTLETLNNGLSLGFFRFTILFVIDIRIQ